MYKNPLSFADNPKDIWNLIYSFENNIFKYI